MNKTRGVLSQRITNLTLSALLVATSIFTAVPFLLSSAVSAVPSTGYFTIYGDTSAAENSEGWMFDRDASTSTPFEFNTDEASIGEGSLYVPPIDGSTPSNKFIAENFINTEIADINSISYDYKIGAGGSASDANEFYMNVYANFGGTSPTKYYDCRYNIVPTLDATSSFETMTFDPNNSYAVSRGTQTWNLTTQESCPSSPANMGEGAFIRMFALNVGDTSANDVNLDGYLDNVVVDSTAGLTTYDFEPIPDTTDPVITINGSTSAKRTYGPGVVRIQVADDGYDRTVIEQKNSIGEYEHRFTYDSSKGKSFKIDWLGDGEYRVQAFDSSENNSSLLVFAIDTTDPTTTLNAPAGGSLVGNIFTIDGEAIDNIALNRVYLQLVHRESSQRYAGTTIHLSGVSDTWSRTFDATALGLPEGTYAAHVSVVDNGGNTSSVGWSDNFQLDKTAPVTYFQVQPPALVSGDFSTRLRVQGETGMINKSIYFNTEDAENLCFSRNSEHRNLDAVCDSTQLPDGVHTLIGVGVDEAGNRTVVESNPFTVDNTNPEVTLNAVPEVLSGTVTFSGTASDATSGLLNDEIRLVFRPVVAGVLQSPEQIYRVSVATDNTWTFDVNTETELTDGQDYRVVARANDKVGGSYGTSNTSADTANTTIDNTAPEVTIVTPVEAVAGDSVTFEGTIVGDYDTITFTLNGVDYTPDVTGENWTVDVDTTGFTPDDYTGTIVAKDAAGNTSVSDATTTVAFTVNPEPEVLGDNTEGTNVPGTDNPPNTTPQSTGPSTPTITGPVNDNEVLGETSDSEASRNGETDVEGTNSFGQAVTPDSDQNQGTFAGLAWYWWLLIIAAVATLIGLITRGVRNRAE